MASIIAGMNLHTPIIPLASLALVGIGLSAPTWVFVAAALLKYGLGIAQPFDLLLGLFASPERFRPFNLISPLDFLGGLCAALLINLCPQINLRLRRN